MRNERSAILAMNGAALLLGGTILFPKLIALPPSTIIFMRAVFAALFLWVFALLRRHSLKISSRKDALIIMALGALLGIHWVLLFYAIQISTVAVAGLSFYTYPVMTAILEPLISREKIKGRDVIVASLAFAGVALMTPSFDLSSLMTRGVLVSLLTAFLFALRNIFNRPFVQRYSGTTVMVYQLAIVAPLLWFLFDINIGEIEGKNLLLLLLLGTVFTALPHTVFTASLGVLKAKTVSVIASIQPLYAAIFAVLLLHEIPTVPTIVGGIVIVSCSLYESFTHKG
ncbi:MAG: DMT family transporter [Deltaproteobacteria bacterium]|nr:DMT family transporter [Deltaproteobacteria bacterium]